jgi:glycosyltransferase involved in cell wall biosynthesis/GT2 family glycosyltransferase
MSFIDNADYFIAVCGERVPELSRLIEIPYWQNLDELRAQLERRDGDVQARDRRIDALQKEVAEKTEWGTKLDERVHDLEQQAQDRDVRIVLVERERDQARNKVGHRAHQALAPWARAFQRILFGLWRTVRVFFSLLIQLVLNIPRTPTWLRRLWNAAVALFIAGRLRGLLLANPPAGDAPQATTAQRDGLPAGVSVVIPTYQGRELLERYLPSVIAETKRCPFAAEIIVADDGSTDGTAGWLAERYPDARIIRREQNRGFAAAANAGVETAGHPIVYLCNSDLEIEPGAIEQAATTLWRTGAFAVASAIEMEDAAKAGLETGLVTATWRNGLPSLSHQPDLGQRPRSTLYAGGGAGAFDRAAFLALGGFDRLYAAYYAEDLDLSYRAWKAGLSVLVEPRSGVVHRHRGTIGRVASGKEIETTLARNLLLFVWTNMTDEAVLDEQCKSLWRNVLLGRVSGGALRGAWRKRKEMVEARQRRAISTIQDDELLAGAGSLAWDLQRTAKVEKAPAHRERLKVLAIAPYCPYPPTHGGAVRMWELLTRLAARHEVHLAAMVEREQELAAEEVLRRYFPRVHLHLRGRPDESPSWWPASVAEFKSLAFERAIDRLCGEEDYDIAQVEYPILSHVLPRFGRAKRVITEIDVYHVSYRRAVARADDWPRKLLSVYEWLRMFRYEVENADRADLLLAVSDSDARVCAELTATAVRTVPNGVDVSRVRFAPRPEKPREVLFIGNFRHPPNVEGVGWFATHVWPCVRDENWGARLVIAGASPPPEVEALAHDPTVRVTGFVEDLVPLYQQAACFVTPILRGSGTRLKILEAMAAGAPVLSTTLGVEGIAGRDGAHFLLADRPEEMARACLRLLGESDLRDSLAANARALVEWEYDWDRIADRLDAAWREVVE